MSITKEISLVRDFLTIEIPTWMTRVFGIASFVTLMALGAHVKFFIPGTPVPVTLQTLFVLLAGAMLGTRDGLSAVGTYILLGVVGLPIFATNFLGGIAYLFGPTGGYLLGFFVATALVGKYARTGGAARTAAVFAAASVLILTLGSLYLAFVLKLGLVKAVMVGVVPFVPGEIIKTGAACSAYATLRHLRSR